VAGPLNRASDQVREQTDEQSVIDEGFGSLNSSLVDVDNIGDFLKGVERNARWENDADERKRDVMNAQIIEGTEEGTCEEIKVFESPENRKTQNQREDQPPFSMQVRAGRSDFLGDQKINRCAADHEREEAPIPPAVEEVAGEEKKNILAAMCETPVHKNDWNQEDEICGGIK
jgi:hypothetical protein